MLVLYTSFSSLIGLMVVKYVSLTNASFPLKLILAQPFTEAVSGGQIWKIRQEGSRPFL
jgi:hypothetical protein